MEILVEAKTGNGGMNVQKISRLREVWDKLIPTVVVRHYKRVWVGKVDSTETEKKAMSYNPLEIIVDQVNIFLVVQDETIYR
jgi:hypothetical protein